MTIGRFEMGEVGGDLCCGVGVSWGGNTKGHFPLAFHIAPQQLRALPFTTGYSRTDIPFATALIGEEREMGCNLIKKGRDLVLVNDD